LYAQEELTCDLSGACLEASVLMHDWLQRHGLAADLVRRTIPELGGHWSVLVPGVGEFDPTIAFWPDAEAWGISGGPGLYHVRRGSPHGRWRRSSVDVCRAYEVAALRPPAGC
jgi:hypothetical protein